jgi:N-6 DNA Methylase
MAKRFINEAQAKLFAVVISQLESLGYRGNLLQKNYQFEDWFAARSGNPSQLLSVDAAAFGRLPLDHESACFAVIIANGVHGPDLISPCRSLAAPMALEVAADQVRVWPVSSGDMSKVRPTAIRSENIRAEFAARANDWTPASVLRAKNIPREPFRPRQLDFIDLGLIPALEEHIRDRLDPLLQRTFFDAMAAYKKRKGTEPDAEQVFRLVFRALAGKVLTDRGVPNFGRFTDSPDPDELLKAVNSHFGDTPRLVSDEGTRRAVVERLWGSLSLRHISAGVLALIWENTLVDPSIRKLHGLHGTPSSLAKLVVELVGLSEVDENERFVVEPCCGSGVFLLAAMKKLTELLSPTRFTPEQRHEYLRGKLSGFDRDSFGVEVARDCLMLADFPNSNHWTVKEEDVFEKASKSPIFHKSMREARVVLCNPPFTPDFSAIELKRYGATSKLKPLTLIERVFQLCPSLTSIGFVLPHQIIAGKSYGKIRAAIARRFGSIDVISLPKSGVFSHANYEVVSLIAKSPQLGSRTVSVTHRKFTEQSWRSLVKSGDVPSGGTDKIPISSLRSLSVPDLQEVWRYLQNSPTLAQVTAKFDRRGIQWNKPLELFRDVLILDHSSPGYKKGIPSSDDDFYSFLSPPTKYLSVKKEDQYRNAFNLPWDRPKVIMNANRRGGGHPWRIAAFADRNGLLAVHNYLAYWPKPGWSPDLVAAVLNGPIANAFVTSHATGRHLLNRHVDPIPFPRLSEELRLEIESLVATYIAQITMTRTPANHQNLTAEQLLLKIDATILRAYDLPPRLERKLLDYFNGFAAKRPVGFLVGDYFPANFSPTLPLHVYLSPEFRKSTAKNLLAVVPEITDPVLIAALEEVE